MNIYERRDWSLKVRNPDPQFAFKEKVAVLATEFLEQPQVSCPLTHIFERGFYIREIAIPADTLFIGRPHRHGHKCELVKGELLHVTPYGRLERQAPFALVTLPGYQVVIYAITDVIGRTYHPDSGERDTDKLEAEIFESVESVKELGLKVQHRLLEAQI